MSLGNFCICGHHRKDHWWWNSGEKDRALTLITEPKCFGGSNSDKQFLNHYLKEFEEDFDGSINCGYQIDVYEHETECKCRLFEDPNLPIYMTGQKGMIG